MMTKLLQFMRRQKRQTTVPKNLNRLKKIVQDQILARAAATEKTDLFTSTDGRYLFRTKERSDLTQDSETARDLTKQTPITFGSIKDLKAFHEISANQASF